MKKRITTLAMVVAIVTVCSQVFAATIRVPQDQPTIQAGINAAVNGDTVLVADGTYTGTGNKEIEYFGKAITVISENGPASCIIDCQNSGRGFYFRGGEGNGSVLDGLTIRNGYVSGGYISNRGGGIRIGGNSSPVIRNCVITQNEATGMGSGVYVANSATVFENCIISFNDGTGLSLDESGGVPLIVTGCTFESNLAGGFFGGTVNMTDCTIRNNMDTGVQCRGTVHNCIFTGNRGWSGAGLVLTDGSVTNCTFSGNISAGLGGAIYCSSSGTVVIGGTPETGNTFSGNTAGAGADIFCSMYEPVTINTMYNTFSGSCYSDYQVSPQEAFDLTGSASGETLINQDVYVSTAGDDAADGLSPDTAFRTVRRAAGKVYGTVENPVTIHVAAGQYSPSLTGECFPLALTDFVRIEGEGSDQTFFDTEFTAGCLVAAYDDDCSVSGLTLANGADGVYNFQSTVVYQGCDILGSHGSGVKISGGDVTMTVCGISDHASFGMQISAARGSFSDCRIMHNGRTGIYGSDATLDLSSCMILDNHAVSDYGGGMYLYGGMASVSNTLILDNIADEDGGGISCAYGTILDLANCIFEANSAGRDAGALTAHYDCIVDMMNCTFTSNSASRYGGAVSMLFDCSLN